MNLLLAWLVVSVPSPDLDVLWARYIDTQSIEVSGNTILLRSELLNYTVLDTESGMTIGRVENSSQAKISSNKVLIRRGPTGRPDAIEAWTISPFERVWSMPVSERVGLGEIVGDHLYYGTDDAVVKVSLPEFTVLDRRAFPKYHSPLSPRVNSSRVYFARMHEVYGLDANNLAEGWRNYCDCWPQYVDEHGFVGTGRINYPIAIVRLDGITVPYERTIDGQYTFWRDPPAVTDDTVIASGSISVFTGGPSSHEVTVLSQYLFAFDRKNGKQLWKLPMSASSPVIIGGKLFHVGGNNVKGELVETYQLRDVRTGKLIWKSEPIVGGFDGEIVSNGELLFERTDGRIRALRLTQ